MKSKPQETGLTIVEMAVSAILLAMIAGALMSVFARGEEADQAIRLRSALIRQGTEALRRIVTDLRVSGNVEIGGTTYPLTSDVTLGAPGVPHRQITIAKPRDTDEDGEPDIVDAQLVWSSVPVDYIVDSTAGRTRLLRREGPYEEVVLDRVEQVRFDTAESSGWTVPVGCVRIKLVLQIPKPGGTMRRKSFSTLVRI